MVGVPIVEVKPCTLTEDEHNALPLTEDCPCPETTPEQDAVFLEEARKKHGWVDIPIDAEWTRLQATKRTHTPPQRLSSRPCQCRQECRGEGKRYPR